MFNKRAIIENVNNELKTIKTSQMIQINLKPKILLFVLATFGISILSAQSPGGINTNLKLWLKADAGTGTTTNLAAVSTWADQSGQGNNANQATATNQPVYVKEGFGYSPTVYFDGLNDFMITSKNQTLNTVYSKFIVYKDLGLNTNNNNRTLVGDNSFFRLYYTTTGNDFNVIHNGGANAITATGATAPNKSLLASPIYEGTAASKVYINGTNKTTAVPQPSATHAVNPLVIGAFNNSGAENIRAYIAEVINYESVLSVAQIQQVETYLGIKYGLSLGHNYISAAGTTLYNSDGTAGIYTFDNNIIGIGREDASSLYQKQTVANERADILIVSNGSLAADNSSNTSTITDGSFFITGNNAGTLTGGTTIPGGLTGINKILNRRWMGNTTGVMGPTTLRFDPSRITNFLVGSTAYLITADDAAFTTNVQKTPATLVGNYLDVTYTFTGTKYYTLGWQDGTTTAVSPVSLLTNGDFTNGYTGWTTDYTTGSCIATNAVIVLSSGCFNTPSGTTNSGGNYLAVNAGAGFLPFYKATVTVTPNTIYDIGFFASIINDVTGNIGVYINGKKVGETGALSTAFSWNYFKFQYDVPPGITTLNLDLRAELPFASGNDFAVDDISFAPALAGVQAFGCDNNLYLSQNTSTGIYSVNTAAAPYTFGLIGSASTLNYNATGINPVDGIMYAITSTNNLISISSTGATTSLGAVTGLPAGTYVAGEFDNLGNYYVKSGATNQMYRINVTTLTATLITLTGAVNLPDFAYSVTTGLLYGINAGNGQLVSINPTTGVQTSIGPTPGGANYAMFASSTGELYGINTTGGLYQFNPTNGQRVLVANTAANTNADGAHCVTAPIVITNNADLSITKTDSKVSYTAGTNSVYTIVAKNNGTLGVLGATVTDLVPSGIPAANMTYTAVATAGSTTNVSGTQSGAINDVVNLAAGGTVTYTVTIAVPATFTGDLTNTASVTAPSTVTDPLATNNTATDTDFSSVDRDGDGIPNSSDLDDDNDGILDAVECPTGTEVVTNGTFTGNATGWSTGGWVFRTNQMEFDSNDSSGALSQSLSGLSNTNNFIAIQFLVGYRDNGAAAGSTATLNILLNGTIFASITNGSLRNTTNVTGTTSNGATWNFVTDGTSPTTNLTVNGGYRNQTVTLLIPNTAIPNTATLNFAVNAIADDFLIDNVSVKTFGCDTDGDGILDHLDLDSDNDGCYDAVEGDENITPSQLNNGSINSTVDSQGVPILVNAGGAADIGSDQGQGIGTSQNSAVQDVQCAGSFGCTTAMYLSQNNTLYNINTASNPFMYPTIGTASVAYNAIGLNPLDGRLYGMQNTSNNVIVINTDGSSINLGSVAGLPTGISFNAGEIDNLGNYYVKNAVENLLYRINLSTMTATTITLSTSINVPDLAYNVTTGLLYGVNAANGQLVSINPATGNVVAIGSAPGAATFGAMFASSTGEIYGADNTGGFYQFNITNGQRVLISSSPASSNNDGAHCVTTPITFGADLAITKTDGVTTYSSGTNTTYTIVVSNNGPFGVLGATVSDLVPSGIPSGNVSYTATVAGNATTSVTGTQTGAINDVVNLPIGATVTYTVVVSIPSSYSGNLVNTVTVTAPSNITDSNTANNTATDTDTQLAGCYKPAIVSGTILSSNHGITALERAGANNGNWPMVRNGAWTVLEAKTKGFVPNRLSSAQIAAIPAADLAEGMMVYNTTLDCLQINTTGTPSGWSCFNTPACP